MAKKRDYNVFFYLFAPPKEAVKREVRDLLIGFCKEAINKVLSKEEIEKLFELHKDPNFLRLAEKFPLLRKAFNDAFTERRRQSFQKFDLPKNNVLRLPLKNLTE